MNDLVSTSANNLQPKLDGLSEGLSEYLDLLGLPNKNILVEMNERGRVIKNLPDIVLSLPPEILRNCLYISKFTAACAVGLFDAALNYLWDEVVVNLRKKVTEFDLEYFFDSTITNADKRKDFTTASDLIQLDDWELIRGCRQTGILSEVGFKHLDYIRDMRNWASAAHPNQTQLTGLQLISWLETSIKEVIAKEIAGPVIEINRLLHNMRERTLTEADANPVTVSIQRLPPELVKSLLRTIFGMYVDTRIGAPVRNNIRMIAKSAWDASTEDVRYELGLRFQSLSVNAELDRKTFARQFLEIVQGLVYLPEDTISVELNELIDNLETAHHGFNNFHNEPTYARAIYRFIPSSGSIPNAVRSRYVKVIVLCSIGNGHGISVAANVYYMQMIELMQEREIFEFVKLLQDSDVISRVQFNMCVTNFRELANNFYSKVTNVHLQRALQAIISGRVKLSDLGNDKRYISEIEAVKL